MVHLAARTAAALGIAVLLVAPAQRSTAGRRVFEPNTARFSKVINGTTQVVDHLGRKAIRLVPPNGTLHQDTDMLAILNDSELKDGTIEIDVSGAPMPNAPEDVRGFIGIAFHVTASGDKSEVLYLRPTNGRSDDQLRRNHSVQYISAPDYPWERLRKETPGVYESYADLEPGVWTKMRIVIAGTTARLYVNGAPQPCLVVNDLKRGATGGSIALWAHISTDAYFGAMTVTSP